MNQKQIRSLLTIVELGSIAKSANKLCLAPSTISQQIKELSQELGVELFQPAGRGIQLTDTGNKLLPSFRQFQQLAEDIKAEAQSSHTEAHGTLRIFAPSSMCIYRLPLIIDRLQASSPNIEVILIHEPYDYQSALRHREIDAAITVSETIDSEWHNLALYKEEVLYVTHPNRHKKESLSLSELQKEVLITTEAECTYRLAAETHFSNEKIQLRPRQTFSNVEVIKRCLLTNMGIGLLPKCVIQEELNLELLKHQKVSGTPYPFHSYLIYPKNRSISSKLNAFIDAAQQST
ncbi:LysR family transcriptional regulator [Marinomonas sp. 15G1-11]|uniref:LysR family transcriptional regulator n=1 Tax=Marinomonas phaeophyticola TaxID=3004091 RepID=A0ABT4JT80_9GAMM|nr:LysR family transcriptional regulator [Marinomonas sp. 15G1-11]MCZ2720809.1 LysR family transcriptional regulator [Marinomonas sp. 15G1-11]